MIDEDSTGNQLVSRSYFKFPQSRGWYIVDSKPRVTVIWKGWKLLTWCRIFLASGMPVGTFPQPPTYLRFLVRNAAQGHECVYIHELRDQEAPQFPRLCATLSRRYKNSIHVLVNDLS